MYVVSSIQTDCLGEDGLRLALGAEVTLEALAEAGGVIAKTTAGAIAAKVVALAKEDVTAGRAFLKGAVRTTGTKVANAADFLKGIPRLGVGLRGFVCKLFLDDAAATVVAVGWAHGALTGLAVVSVEALALASLAVARSLHGAFYLGVGTVVGSGVVNPGSGLGASAHGAIVLGPGRIVILRALVARALVVTTAG